MSETISPEEEAARLRELPVVPHTELRRPATAFEWTVVFIAMGFGSGMPRYAPGTWGSAMGVLLAWGCWQCPDPVRWTLTIAAAILGVPLCDAAAKYLGQKDPRHVVWDEIAAVLLVYAIVPVTIPTALLGFLLFRLFDIWKPWPIERLERLPGGLGIMADDLAAGVMGAAILWGATKAWPGMVGS